MICEMDVFCDGADSEKICRSSRCFSYDRYFFTTGAGRTKNCFEVRGVCVAFACLAFSEIVQFLEFSDSKRCQSRLVFTITMSKCRVDLLRLTWISVPELARIL